VFYIFERIRKPHDFFLREVGISVVKNVTFRTRQLDFLRVVLVIVGEEAVVVRHQIFQASERHVVVDCALMFGKDNYAVIDFHRHVVLDVVVDHILQRDRLYLNLADFEVRVVNRVVER